MPDDDDFSIGEVVATVMSYKWFILAFTSFALVVGVLALFAITPIYRANSVLQVEETSKGLPALKELQGMFEDTTSVSTEMEIITSRMVLGRVVDRMQLTIKAEPVYLPLFGKGYARRQDAFGPVAPVLGLSSYAWGGEQIKVESFEVPDEWLGFQQTLIVGENGQYQLLDGDDNPVFEGKVGETATAQGFSLFLSNLQANPGTRFALTKFSREEAIENILENLSVTERGKKSGVLEVSLLGPDRALASVTLDEIMTSYVRQNVERRSAEAENTLKFLEAQLPELKRQLDTAEASYNNYRQTRGSVDLTLETQSVLQSIVEVDNDIVKLQQQREELRQNYTAQHPRVMTIDAQLERLRSRRGVFDRDVSRLPDTQQTALQLKRDVEVSTALYTQLLNTAQQLRVSKAGTVGDVRVIDTAITSRLPVKPKPKVVLALALVLGVAGALGLIWLRKMMRVVVEDPEKIEKGLGLPVYATVPHSAAEVALARRVKAQKQPVSALLALETPEDDAIESLRSLRTTLHFALMDANAKSILISGASPAVGKSFIARNLGTVLAQSGKTVALVDGDLRKGHLHREFGFGREGGVSEYVSGSANLAQIVRTTAVPGLSLITTGQRPPNPSELLMHGRFEDLLERLNEAFDVVIVDAPPILAVSDAAIIGRLTGATLIVARAGVHPIGELEQTVKRFSQAGVGVKGFVFNDFDTNRQRYRYGYSGYVYRYNYK
ncbi:capsular biosynthesis protein [Parazoarcus communis]|uniref:Putative tyrosine-protein kinase EpsB n=1 Tax=Parazoarcus communis TaxID=41977 RepID=A0A2U8HAN7_9RHOO|nr:capsular biosynthesis protein [Parazoarcus communis]